MEQQTRRKLDAVKAGPLESGVSTKDRWRYCFVKRNERNLRKRNGRVEYYVGMKQMNDKRSNTGWRGGDLTHFKFEYCADAIACRGWRE